MKFNETDCDSGSIHDGYLDASDDETDSVNPEEELCTVLSMHIWSSNLDLKSG